jgi:phage-related baseplate assembly protein
MQESWIDKTDRVIRDDIVSIAKENTGLTNFKSTGVLRGFIEVLAHVVFFIYKTAINPIYANATLDGATGVFLSFWGLALGVVRKSDNKAAGNFAGHSYGEGTVPAGSWIVVDGTELRYKVTAKTAFTADSEFAIPIEAEFSGSDYNIGSGMTLRITRVIAGLGSVTVRENWQTALGENTEKDGNYRERVKNRWRSQTLGDTKETYKFYAEAVAGVRSAKIIRTPRGPGSTDVIIASVTGLPTPELLAAVETALYDHELMSFDVQVKAPTITNVPVAIEFSGEADEADIALVAEGYVHDLGIGGRFAIKDLYALYEPLGLATVEIISPVRDVQAGESAVITATINVSKAG